MLNNKKPLAQELTAFFLVSSTHELLQVEVGSSIHI
jgi:hypothetical protein